MQARDKIRKGVVAAFIQLNSRHNNTQQFIIVNLDDFHVFVELSVENFVYYIHSQKNL